MALWVEHNNGVLGRSVDQEPKLLRFPPRSVFVLEEFDEPSHFRLQNDGQQRLYQKVYGPKRIPFLYLRAVDVAGGEKDDGCVPGAVIAPDQLGRLEAAEA